MASITHSLPTLGADRYSAAEKVWIDPSKGDENLLASLNTRFVELTEQVSNLETLAREHVYENAEFTLLDARQHRWKLHYLLYNAEELAIRLITLNRPEDTALLVASVDELIARLLKTFLEWHGDPAVAADVPESFKQSMKELATGQGVAMEDDLFADDALAKT